MRIALGLQYDGSPYAGWQVQHNQNTVQAELEKAITAFIGEEAKGFPVQTITAGRTDAGVHALGQVVHFDTQVEREDFSWVRGVNSFLPGSIVVNWAKVVPEEFSARFSAYKRTYIYALHAGPCRSPMIDARAGYVMLPPNQWFDIDAMKEAAQCLIGEHDFTSFRSSECQSKTPVKTMYAIDIISAEPWLYFVIRGNAFLHHMVRNIVGAAIAVGEGSRSVGWIADLLQARDRTQAGITAPAAGLYFCHVRYPAGAGLPERASPGQSAIMGALTPPAGE